MIEDITSAKLQSDLLARLDDAARHLLQTESPAVFLSGGARDAAVLGLISLYVTDPLHCYTVGRSPNAAMAALRFGGFLHTLPAGTDPVEAATTDGFLLINGTDDGPGPFADAAVQAVLGCRPAPEDRDSLIRLTLRPLLGTNLLEQM